MSQLSTSWSQLLWNCYHHGVDSKKDDSNIRELMGNYIYLEQPQNISLSFQEKEVSSVDEYVNAMKHGFYDIPGYPLKGEFLFDYATSFTKNDLIYCSDWEKRDSLGLSEYPFVYSYPERLIHSLYNQSNVVEDPENEWIDQAGVILDRLENNLGSNRAVATLYHPGLDQNREDIPCLNWLQATVRNHKLELHCMFRSNDLYGAWPANMYLLTFLGLSLCEGLSANVCFKGIHYHSSSLHIYQTDLDAVKEILGE